MFENTWPIYSNVWHGPGDIFECYCNTILCGGIAHGGDQMKLKILRVTHRMHRAILVKYLDVEYRKFFKRFHGLSYEVVLDYVNPRCSQIQFDLSIGLGAWGEFKNLKIGGWVRRPCVHGFSPWSVYHLQNLYGKCPIADQVVWVLPGTLVQRHPQHIDWGSQSTLSDESIQTSKNLVYTADREERRCSDIWGTPIIDSQQSI